MKIPSFVALLALCGPVLAQQAPATVPAATAFERLKALSGDWIDTDGTFGKKGEVAVTYRISGGGTAVVETLFAGQPHQMTTIYHKEGSDIVLTHYCSAGNQPRMRAKTVAGNVLEFDFDGGTNLDPSRDGHMHSGRIEWIGADQIRAQWSGWQGGKPSAHNPLFKLARKKSS